MKFTHGVFESLLKETIRSTTRGGADIEVINYHTDRGRYAVQIVGESRSPVFVGNARSMGCAKRICEVLSVPRTFSDNVIDEDTLEEEEEEE